MPTAHDYHFHILADFYCSGYRAYTTTEAVAAGQIKTQSGLMLQQWRRVD